MKFNRTTITLVLVSIGLGSLIYLMEIKPQGFVLNTPNQKENNSNKIFPFKTEEIKTITINVNQEVIQFQRQNRESSPWQMTQPQNLVASEAAMAFLVNLFPQAEKTIELQITNAEQKKVYGLENSPRQIQVTLNNGDRYVMILGGDNFNQTQIYAEVIFPEQLQDKSSIFLVSKSFQYAIERNFDEWKQGE